MVGYKCRSDFTRVEADVLLGMIEGVEKVVVMGDLFVALIYRASENVYKL